MNSKINREIDADNICVGKSKAGKIAAACYAEIKPQMHTYTRVIWNPWWHREYITKNGIRVNGKMAEYLWKLGHECEPVWEV